MIFVVMLVIGAVIGSIQYYHVFFVIGLVMLVIGLLMLVIGLVMLVIGHVMLVIGLVMLVIGLVIGGSRFDVPANHKLLVIV